MTTETAQTEAITVPLRTVDGGSNGTVELPAKDFGRQANISLIHQVVTAQLAARSVVAARSRTSRRAPAAPVRVRCAPLSSPAAGSSTGPSPATTPSAPPRR
jgi:hypothetical protein